MAQTTGPTNETASLMGDIGFLLTTMLRNMNTTAKLTPLTNQAGLTGSPGELQMINPTGTLFLATSNTVANLQNGDIAYISCEPSDYTAQIDSAKTINIAVSHSPSAIVLYSTFAARCNFSAPNTFAYTSMYSMVDANSSATIVSALTQAVPAAPIATIHVDPTTTNGTSNDSGNNNILGRSPTTAVAMIILYSITGIITALFLIIIIVGAVRAHRHPERYGPRRIAGRPRQSRAKGIARAMLETLPIVKFGDAEEENKPPEQRRDIEMVGGPNTDLSTQDERTSTDRRQSGERTRRESIADPETVKTEKVSEQPEPKSVTLETGTPAVDNGLACSVCVEDFEKGQDLRVLPCKHRFHPECIDPWLLNVSGTCPLCRVDLRPTTSNTSEGEDSTGGPSLDVIMPANAVNDGQPDEGTRRNRRSRILSTLNIGRMREATPQERIDALRRLRNEGLLSDPAYNRSRRRFSHRLSRAFGGSRPVSGAPSSRPVSGVPGNAPLPAMPSENEAVSAVEESSNTAHDTPSTSVEVGSTTHVAEPATNHLATIPSAESSNPPTHAIDAIDSPESGPSTEQNASGGHSATQ